MIIVQLNGGMGNQMFQYATAKAIALRGKQTLKLDISFFGTVKVDTPREYELHKLSVQDDFATSDEINAIKGFKPTKLRKLRDKLLPLHAKRHIIEHNMNFIPALLQLGGDLYLEGNWQTEKYFVDFEPEIKKVFTVKNAPNAESSKLLELVNKNQNPVSIHVRRGDYISNANAKSFHGICSPEYYNNCIGLIKSKVPNPVFFIFSDEPDWAKENIKTDAETYVSYNSITDQADDLRLMYSCKHHIIANSSFSWWGAWLSNNPQKIVCCPEQWFANKEINGSNIVPSKWIKVKG